MAFILNPSKKFKEAARLTDMPIEGKYPTNTREAFSIADVHENGIFRIESNKEVCVYDRCYLFTDINYINMDRPEQKGVLKQLVSCLNYMNSDFKITVANEYMNLQEFLDEIFKAENRDAYPTINDGMTAWIKELISRAEMKDLEKVLYLTITVRATSYEEAWSYFTNMDIQLTRMFRKLNSILIPIKGQQRLKTIQKFIYFDLEAPIDFKCSYDDPVLSVVPVDIQASEKNFMIFDGVRYVSVLFAKHIGNKVDDTDAIKTLTSVNYPSYLTLDIAPVDKELLKKKLDNAHMNNERNITDEIEKKRKNGQLMAGISYKREKKKEELEEYMNQVDDNDEECLLASLLLVISADSEEELASRVQEAIRKAKDKNITLDTYNYVQLKAFNTALPIGARLVKYMRSFFTSSLVSLQPFFAHDVMEKGGFLLGRNKTTNHFVFADRKKLPSPHGFISGMTGSGKSFFIKLTEIAQTLLLTNDDMICIDPQNEYAAVCESFQGTFVDFTPQSDVYLNPMEVPHEVTSGNKSVQNQFVADVNGWANSFCEAAMSGVQYTSDHKAAISKCVRGIYEDYFSSRISSQPSLITLRARLAKLEQETENDMDRMRIHQLFNCLEDYTDGIYNMFAHDTNVNMDNRLICFGLANVDSSAWEPVMITIMFFLSNRMEYNRELQRATRLLVDEAQVVTQNEASANILLNAALTFRKFGGLCTFALQNLTRALELPALRDMFQNCGYKVFLDQGGVDKKNLAEIQEFSEEEYESLSSKKTESKENKGHMVIVWNKQVILLDAAMDNTNSLYQTFNTNPHELEERQAVSS